MWCVLFLCRWISKKSSRKSKIVLFAAEKKIKTFLRIHTSISLGFLWEIFLLCDWYQLHARRCLSYDEKLFISPCPSLFRSCERARETLQECTTFFRTLQLTCGENCQQFQWNFHFFLATAAALPWHVDRMVRDLPTTFIQLIMSSSTECNFIVRTCRVYGEKWWMFACSCKTLTQFHIFVLLLHASLCQDKKIMRRREKRGERRVEYKVQWETERKKNDGRPRPSCVFD